MHGACSFRPLCHVPPLDGGPGDHDLADSETDTAVPDGSHQVSDCLIRPGVGRLFGRRWLSRTTTWTSSFAALCHPPTFSSKTSSKTSGVSCQVKDKMLAMEWEIYRRCFPAQPALSALQRFNGRKCAFLLRHLAATADLPPHGALFSQ